MPIVSGGGGGGGATQPVTRANYGSSDVVNIANNATAYLLVDTKVFGTSLLNTASPTGPLIVTTGTYAVSALVHVFGPLTAAGHFLAKLALTGTDDEYEMTVDSALDHCEVSGTWYLPATSRVSVRVTNSDGVAARDFEASVFLQSV